MSQFQPLTDLQWHLLEPLFPVPVKRGRGKPHTPWRCVVNAILFVLVSGGKWDSLPKEATFSSKSAAHRWYKAWRASGLLDQILGKLREFSAMAAGLTFPKHRNRTPKPIVPQQAAVESQPVLHTHL